LKRLRFKSFLINLVITLVLTAVYMILAGRFDWLSALIGLGISILALLLTNRIFLATRYQKAFTMNGHYFVYIGYLLWVILKSAAVSLVCIFSRGVVVNLIPYQTQLQDENLKSMLANAITLTPGTVTADIKGDTIEVMKLCRRCKLDQAEGFAKIEKLLARMERRNAA